MLGYLCILIFACSSSYRNENEFTNGTKDISILLSKPNYLIKSRNNALPCYLVDSKFFPQVVVKIPYRQTEEMIAFYKQQIYDYLHENWNFTEVQVINILKDLKNNHPSNIPLLSEINYFVAQYERNTSWLKIMFMYIRYKLGKKYIKNIHLLGIEELYIQYKLFVNYHTMLKLSTHGCSYILELTHYTEKITSLDQISLADENTEEVFLNEMIHIDWIIKYPQKSIELYGNPYEPLSFQYQAFYHAYHKLKNNQSYYNEYDALYEQSNEVYNKVNYFVNHPIRNYVMINVNGKMMKAMMKETKNGLFGKKIEYFYLTSDQINTIAKEFSTTGKTVTDFFRIGMKFTKSYIIYKFGFTIRALVYYQVPEMCEKFLDNFFPRINFLESYVLKMKSWLSGIAKENVPQYDDNVFGFLKKINELYVAKLRIDSSGKYTICDIYIFPRDSLSIRTSNEIAKTYRKIKNKFF